MSSLNNALCSAVMCRKLINTDIEKYLNKMKGPKSLIKSNPTKETKEAYAEAVKLALTQLRGRFYNCVFANKKTKTHTMPNGHIVQEMMNLSNKFKFLPENLENCKSINMLKKSEDGRAFQKSYYRSNMHSLQMEKVYG